jgi:hypothetical protein
MSRLLLMLSPLALMLHLAGCASDPIIDTRNVDMVQYEKDLADCEQVAEQVDTGGKAAKSAAAGAAVGAALGAIWGDVGSSAAAGAVSGGSGGLLSADEEKARVVKNCLRNRGYAILN